VSARPEENAITQSARGFARFAKARKRASLLLAGLLCAPGAFADDRAAHKNYLLHCSGCHLADGAGAPLYGVPDLRATVPVFLQTPGGRDYLAQVPGVMNAALDDARLAAVMNWTATTFGAGIAFAPYDGPDMGRLRATRPLDIFALRAALMSAHKNRTP
jgi:mono/diheme cytochrome c family protein